MARRRENEIESVGARHYEKREFSGHSVLAARPGRGNSIFQRVGPDRIEPVEVKLIRGTPFNSLWVRCGKHSPHRSEQA